MSTLQICMYYMGDRRIGSQIWGIGSQSQKRESVLNLSGISFLGRESVLKWLGIGSQIVRESVLECGESVLKCVIAGIAGIGMLELVGVVGLVG